MVAGTTEAEFLADDVLQAAVLHHLSVIGKAVTRLSAALKEKYPDVPWHEIAAVRRRIAHAYFDLDWQILWGAATEDVPDLRWRAAGILHAEFPE